MSKTKNILNKLADLGQSVWCDNLSRHMIESGELKNLIDNGVVGVTSNPTIFMKAITSGEDYDERFTNLLDEDRETMALYEGLVIPDIVDACDLLMPVFERTKGLDGYVSLEVNPRFAFRPDATIEEAKRLFREIDRPNLFIKVPATEPCLPAIETLIGAGINVNVTLIFAIAMYRDVMQAYLNGLRKFRRSGGDLSKVASVASFFVSRVDTLVDKLLEEKRKTGAKVDHLFGKAAIANAKLAYVRFQETFDPNGPFAELAQAGARVQRPLWASTSTKNPKYSDTMYVDNLVGPNTVNTLPPATIQAVLDHGKPSVTLTEGVEEARCVLAELGNLDIHMPHVTDQLTREGVDLFTQSFDDLLASLEKKRKSLKPVEK
jgi:transaldolase / glucose-6-phosphate isomerase